MMALLLQKHDSPVRVCDHCATHEKSRLAFERGDLKMLQQGALFKKHPNGHGRCQLRVVKLSSDRSRIVWSAETKAPRPEAHLLLDDITKIASGLQTPTFKRTGRNTKDMEGLCFSFITSERTLDLECDRQVVRDKWMNAFTRALFFRVPTTQLQVQLDLEKELAMDKDMKARKSSKATLAQKMRKRLSKRSVGNDARAKGPSARGSQATTPAQGGDRGEEGTEEPVGEPVGEQQENLCPDAAVG